ncbi:ATP-dependent DNA ligase [Kytococcus sedentarius]|uniref:ATP-dependent DNA ligase n=1 Tax=Kytococcus sedentarius TaxID=1276 RepID=UPI0035BC1174
MARSDRKVFTVGKRRLSVSSLDKVLYPETGTTKADVMHYYLSVAEVLLPQLAGRPVTRKRWVDGVGTQEDPGEVFFRKDLEDSAPDWITTGRIVHSHRANNYPLATEPAVLAWFAQVAALELHTPQWRFGRNGQPRNPDRMVLDLDPGEGVGLAECAEVARWCHEVLDGMGLEAHPVTSGSKGIHLYAALDGTHNSEQVSAVARELARALEADHPDLVISTMKRASRAGRVFLDWSQNNASKTTVAPYSLRGRVRPTVAAPRSWEELADPDLAQLDLHQVLERVAEGIDPLAALGLDAGEQADAGASPAAVDRLETYRSMRDPERTAEPVPAEAPVERDLGADELPSFVIQEHHASSLHWDFRLEHSGVLVSWAVPKGPPLEHDTNRLAVMTEDHPLEYGTFEGTIAKGEYGAGEVSIWDAGVYEREKWREGKEVIAVLHGRPDGGLGGVPRRFALIQATGMGSERNWLVRLTDEQPDADQAPGADDTPGPDPAPKPAAEKAPSTRSGTRRAGRRKATPGFTVADLPAAMLATSGTPEQVRQSVAAGEDWAFEMKWDGYRVVAGVRTAGGGEEDHVPDEDQPGQGAAVVLASRNGKELTAAFPAALELADLLTGEAAERGGAVLDGELVALDARGRPDFGLLQAALGDGPNTDEEGHPIELRYIVFDLLQLGPPGGPESAQRSLLRTPWAERRALLTEVLGDGGEAVSVPPAHTGTLAQAERASRELGLEGVVAKRADAVYLPGQRGQAWVKLKTQRHQEVVVIGAREGRGGRSGGIGSLLVAVPDEDGQLRYAGRVGTGFSAAQLRDIEKTLRRIERRTPPVDDVPAADRSDAWWVTAKRVGEVALAGRTRDGRLRQAAWRGWRPDKAPGEVRWEL